jgi:hypothetical protein
MRRNVAIYAICIAFALCGCSVVTSKGPVGDAPAVLNAKDWDGAWFSPGGGYCAMKAKNENEGILQLAWIEDHNEMIHKSRDVFIRKSGNWLFASMKEEDDKDAVNSPYVWAIIKKSRKTIFIWLPKEERFKKLIEAKTLPGEAQKSVVMLGDLKPEHMKIITSEERSFLFDWEDPLVLIKLSD